MFTGERKAESIGDGKMGTDEEDDVVVEFRKHVHVI